MYPLEYTVVIATVLPGEGSQIGGTEITITGVGFASVMSDSDSMEWNLGNEILADAYERALVANDNECSDGWENVVMVGGWECDVITANHMTITCITPANQNFGIINVYNVTVHVQCRDMGSVALFHTVSDGFTYSDALTPAVGIVTPTQGSIYGGTIITITGIGFSTDPSEVTVMVCYWLYIIDS